nr:MAG TPA: hypothetical protein [Caudoviricetes sp.]
MEFTIKEEKKLTAEQRTRIAEDIVRILERDGLPKEEQITILATALTAIDVKMIIERRPMFF